MRMKTLKPVLCMILCLLTVIMAVACGGGAGKDSESVSESTSASDTASETDTESTSESDSESETETEGLTPEEEKRLADEAYLQTVTYKTFALTGKNEPYFVGRWFEKEVEGENHMVTTTDGSHLYFMVEGTTEINVNFTPIHRKVLPYFAYSIDGAEPVRQHITEPTVTLPDAERHTVCIIADGLTESENKWGKELGFALKSVTAGEGTITGIKPAGKTIFFYGDSITEGVRALNMNADSDGNSATHAYPWYTAETLNAAPYYVGYGASGLIKQGSFSTMLKAIDYLSYNRKLESSEVADITPDLIVVNHGANDQDQSAEAFETALRTAVARLQEKYPEVPIVYVVPYWSASNPNVVRQGEVIQKVAAEIDGMYVVETSDWGLTYTDEGLHPNAAGAEKAGEKLSAALKEILGEEFFAA